LPGCKDKSRPARRAKTAFAGKNYCFFSVESELPDAAGAVGELLEEDDDGELLEPLAALPLLLGGVPEALELDEPPEAGALGEALDEELELLSLDEGAVTEPEAEPEAEPDGGVVEPADEDDEEPGALAPVLVVASRSQAVSRLAPSARDTAVARMDSLMRPPWLGYHPLQQHSGHPGSTA
jgi:hypothetical protein